MAIHVCDAIMGSGKSSAIIAHMNRHPDRHYIYVTPFLDEAKRVRQACPALHFVEPSDKMPEYHFNKYNHVVQLLKDKKNITSTHQMFRHFKDELLELIRAGQYTLVIDEAVDVFQELVLKPSDLDIVNMMGWIGRNGESAVTSETPVYQGDRFRDVFDLARGGNFAVMSREGDTYYWVMSRGFFTVFEDVYILTYLFPAQTLKYYFDMNGIGFDYIGINHPADGIYEFTGESGYIPSYVGSLGSKIHILDNKKLNEIGNRNTALSSSWFQRRSDTGNTDMETLRRNLRNYFIHYMDGFSADARLWSTYKDAIGILRGKGYYNNTLVYNSKATNAYRHKRVLAYCVNIFMKPDEKRYFLSHGVEVHEDEAALSTMIQWIWRSAIRDGQEVWIYIPSKRMRHLLQGWIKQVEQQYKEYTMEMEVA